MKKVLLGALVLAVVLPLGIAAQNATDRLKDFTRILKAGDGLQVSLVHLNDKTLPLIFQPPTIYAMRVRANQGTLLYVQGTAQKEIELDTGTFTLEQNGESTQGRTMNIKNFVKGMVAKGDRVDGVIEFAKKVDLSKAFKVTHGDDSTEFKFTENQVKQMTPPPAATRQN